MMKRKQTLFPLRYGRGTQKVSLYASGNKYGTAWFGFANGVVKQVRFDK